MTHTIDKLAEVLEGFLETLYFWFMWPFQDSILKLLLVLNNPKAYRCLTRNILLSLSTTIV